MPISRIVRSRSPVSRGLTAFGPRPHAAHRCSIPILRSWLSILCSSVGRGARTPLLELLFEDKATARN